MLLTHSHMCTQAVLLIQKCPYELETTEQVDDFERSLYQASSTSLNLLIYLPNIRLNLAGYVHSTFTAPLDKRIQKACYLCKWLMVNRKLAATESLLSQLSSTTSHTHTHIHVCVFFKHAVVQLHCHHLTALMTTSDMASTGSSKGI